MSELWIRFADPDFHAFQWWRFDAGDQTPGSRGEGQGEALAALEPAATCRIFVPQPLLLTLRVQLPPKASRQQIQAIGFAIEDQLANDVEDNHYATGSQQADGSLAVVVIERTVMDRLLERLRAARLRHDFIHPEMLLCPPPGDEAFACLCRSPEGWLLRLDAAEALAVPDALLADSLSWIRASRGAGDDARLDCCEAVHLPDSHPVSCRKTSCEISRKMLTDPAVNLLQGDYRPGSRWRERLKPWRSVALLLAGLLLVLLAATVVERFRDERHLRELQQRQWALIDRYLPQTPHKGDPKRILVQRLSAAGPSSSSAGPVELLADFAGIHSGFPQLEIGRLLYRGSELVVDLEAPQLKVFEDLEKKLKQRQLGYRIENLDIGPSKTRARLILGGSS